MRFKKPSELEETALLNIAYQDGSYYAGSAEVPDESNPIANSLWYVVKFLDDGRKLIRQGYLLRFGRLPFRVTKLTIEDIFEGGEVQRDQAP